MKIIKFFMKCGTLQAVAIEELVGNYLENNALPQIANITLQRRAGYADRYREIPWSYSKYIARKGKSVNCWFDITSTSDLYSDWEEYEDYCAKCGVGIVDDLLETILESPTFGGENFLKIIINEGNEEVFDINDYITLKNIKNNLDPLFKACI